MTKYRLRAYLYLTVVAAIWGIAGPIIKFTLGEFPPLIFLTYRFFLTSLILAPIILIKKSKFPKKASDIFILFLIALLGSTINLGFLFYGLSLTTVLDQTLISTIAPLGVLLAGAIFLNEQVTKREKLGTTIAFLGTLTVVIQPLFENKIFSYQNILGNLFIVVANLAWVAYVILSKYGLKHKLDPLLITSTSFFVGFITLLPLAILESGSIRLLLEIISKPKISSHAGVFYMAWVSGALAYFLFQRGQKTIEASEAILFSYLQPLFAAPLAIIWLREKVTPIFLTGAILISIGVVIAEYKKKR